MTEFTPKPPRPSAPPRGADFRAVGALLTGIGFAALGIGAGCWFAVSAWLGLVR